MDKPQLPKMLKKLQLFVFFVCTLIGFSSNAQTFPVSVTTQILQPSPIYLSNYADATTINSPIKLQLVLNDLTISNRQVRLKLYFQGNSISFSSNNFVVGARPLYLEGGFPLQLTNVDLAPYFEYQNILGINPNQYAQPLPEGVYNFSVEVYDFATNKKLSKKTAVTTIIFQNEPPFLNLPLNGASIMQQNIQNIVFSWTPRSINVSNVEYEFSLVEIWDNYTPVQNAFAYSPPLYTTTTRNTTLQYGITQPQLIPGKKYAWRIKAKAILGAEEIGVFKNNGYSEIFSFTYEVFCTAPLSIATSGVSQDQAKITWSGSIDNYDYQVNYREKNSTEWYKLVTPRETINISNLKPNTAYEYTVGASCDVGKYTHSTIHEFTTLARDEIAFAGCGIQPDPKDLKNKNPLPSLFPNDVVTAGDFPIVVLHASGSNGSFTGDGYVTLPFLEKFRKLIDAADAAGGSNIGKFSRIRITFNNIGVNTDFKLISGEIVASYDPNWGSMIDGDKLVDSVVDEYDPIMESIYGPKPKPGDEDVDNSEEQEADSIAAPDPITGDTTLYNPIDIVEVNETIPNPPPIIQEPAPEENKNNDKLEQNNGEATPDGYFIEYKGQKYYNGGKIKIPYARHMFETFEMKTVPKDAKVMYSIHEPGQQQIERVYDGYTSKTSIPIEDIKIAHNLLIQDLQAKAISIEGEPKVKVEVEKVVSKFTQKTLTATDLSNSKRVANEKETLYYINNTATKEYKETEFKAVLSQSDFNKIPKEFIKWKINNIDDEHLTGETNFKVTISDKVIDSKYVFTSGYPLTTKEVNIKWVNEDFKQDKLAFKYEGLDKILKLVDILKTKLDIPVHARRSDFNKDKNFSIYVEAAYKNERKNIESEIDRLYYKETKNTIGIEMGAKGKIEKRVPYLSIPEVDETVAGKRIQFKLGLYWFVEASATGELAATKYTTEWIEKPSKNKSTWSYGDPSEIVLGATFGLNPKVVLELPGVKGEASGKTSAKIDFFKYDFKKKEASCPLLTEGIKGTITPVTELEIGLFSYSKQWDKIECIIKI